MQLYYNTGGSKAYNGNILYQWSGVPGNLSNHYHYTYDNLNRLISGSSSGNYNETGISYDLNGNITALKRSTGTSTLTDDLTYTYTSGTYYTNQLQTVNDLTGSDIGQKHGLTTYTYDANGNLFSDNSKGITSIAYNILDLPQNIPDKSTTYTYDASGQKLRRVIGTTTADYISGIEYDNSTTALAFIQTEEGRAVPNGATAYNYQYFLTDHLGNSRVSFETKTGAAVQVQQDDYYPFGMEILRTSPVPTLKNEYLYNRKELQENTGLYDYGARLYDAVVGRWTTIDPLAELGRRWSPYNYGEDNPIGNIDPDGMWSDVVVGGAFGGQETSDPGEIAAVLNQVKRQKPKKQKGQDDAVNVPKQKNKEDEKKQQTKNIFNAEFKALKAFADLVPLFAEPILADEADEGVLTSESAVETKTITWEEFDMIAATQEIEEVKQKVSLFINAAKQGKHILGHNNYLEGRSILTADADILLDNFVKGNVKSIQAINENKTRVDFGEKIGYYISEDTKIPIPTTKGTVITSKNGVHIVPARP